jgi:GTP pyrophosphokinase
MYPVAIHIEAWDRVGLLRDITTLVAEEKVNMVGVHTQEMEDGRITIFVTLETMGLQQLSRLLSRVEAIRGVVSVSRRLEGARKRG